MAVHEAIVEDPAFQSETAGKRLCVGLDGSRLIMVHLDKAWQKDVQHKGEILSCVYNKLTGKDCPSLSDSLAVSILEPTGDSDFSSDQTMVWFNCKSLEQTPSAGSSVHMSYLSSEH
ncbi:hypothetical protein CB1_000621013 [Camelus ferus]|nr:hypothetical protein CB1_000621013 [Camelus ferus]